MEIVLGIDNVVFISILAGRLPPEQRDRARVVGLALAMLMRVGLLFSINWIANLTTPLFAILVTWTFLATAMFLLLWFSGA